MGEAKRRRNKLNETGKKMHVEGGGVYAIDVCDGRDLAVLLGLGGGKAQVDPRLVDMIEQLLRAAHEDPLDKKPMCLLCDTVFTADTHPKGFAALRPARDDFATALFSGICRECLVREDFDTRVRAKILEGFAGGVRELRVNVEAGSA